MRGRIPNRIKQQAQQDYNKFGSGAYHYACYNIDWSKPLTAFESRYLSALSTIIGREDKQ